MGPGGDPAILIEIWKQTFPVLEGGSASVGIMLSMVAIGISVLCVRAFMLQAK